MNTRHIATKIVRRLREAGHIAYFAGGWVRDLLLGHPSSDVDIATDASPEKILDLFPHTIHVGVAFGVVIVTEEGHAFEVATFRKDIDYVGGRKPSRIEAATPEEDAKRRDFTINGMFFDPLSEVIHDFVGGREDLIKGVIRTIGHPDERFFEDRLRMIRAIRFAARFQFHIDPATEAAIKANAPTLFPAVSMERIWQELSKMATSGHMDYSLMELHRLELLQTIFPKLSGTHLQWIKERVMHMPRYPREAPLFAYLLPLFPDIEKNTLEEMGRYLRASQKDIQWAILYKEIENLLKKDNGSLVHWCHLLADPRTSMILTILTLSYPQVKAILQKKEEMLLFIERIASKTPLITALKLQQEGIKPGKKMGALLQAAEEISITHGLHDPVKVLEKLKEHPLWKSP